MAAAASACTLVLPDLDLAAQDATQPFGTEFPELESLTTVNGGSEPLRRTHR